MLSRLGKLLSLAAGLSQRILALLDEFMAAINSPVQRFSALVDDFIELIFGACRIVSKEVAHLRTRLWREEECDTRADQRSCDKDRQIPGFVAIG